MSKTKPQSADPKVTLLRKRGCLNSQPDRVTDPLFSKSDFFDARDTIQIKYEMLRRVRVDGQSVAQSARAFGFSRPSYYQVQSAFEAGGLPALLPSKPGPRAAHKLRDEIVDWLITLRATEPGLSPAELAERVAKKFAVSAHPRSIERALARRKKNACSLRAPSVVGWLPTRCRLRRAARCLHRETTWWRALGSVALAA